MHSVDCDIGVAACTVSGNQILLVQEASGPHANRWGVPKGFVESGELPFDAALRELREECGIGGEVNGLVGVRETVRHGITSIFLAYSVEPRSLDVKWIPRKSKTMVGSTLINWRPLIGLARRCIR